MGLKQKKLSPGKESQEREVLKADAKLRRKITETTGFSVFLEDDYFYPKVCVKRQQIYMEQEEEYGSETGSEPLSSLISCDNLDDSFTFQVSVSQL